MAAAAALIAFAPLLASCSSGEGQDATTSTQASAAPSIPASDAPTDPSPSPEPSTADGGDAPSADLPDNWPVGLPSYEGGRLLSVTISDDGLNVNAAWSSDATAEAAWAAMDTALRDEGFAPTREAGGEDMLVEDETMKSDYYQGNGFEVNLVVVPGGQTTVLVNASQL